MDEVDWRGIDSTQVLKTNLKEKKFFAASWFYREQPISQDTFHTMSSTWRGGELLKIKTLKNIHSKRELGLLQLGEVILAETLQLVPLLQFK